jgi:predicted DCC family thiol-disulfide oxidoreductase YuxK
MLTDNHKIIVYYDGACPKCVRDRQNYEKLSGKAGEQVCWFDITDREEQLREIGIDPQKALSELHIKDENGRIVTELDAYILLISRIALLKPMAWLIGLPLIRPLLAKIYHRQVNRRLKSRGLLR